MTSGNLKNSDIDKAIELFEVMKRQHETKSFNKGLLYGCVATGVLFIILRMAGV